MRQKEKLIKDLDLIGYIFEIEKNFVFDWIDVLVQLWSNRGIDMNEIEIYICFLYAFLDPFLNVTFKYQTKISWPIDKNS